MTGYTVHTGSSEDFAEGWDRVFKDNKPKSADKKKKPAKTQAKSAKAKKSKKKT